MTAIAFQSTHPLRGATKTVVIALRIDLFQSTHPLRGATTCSRPSPTPSWRFQSTHPLRGATKVQAWQAIPGSNFNPRTPCGVRRGVCSQSALRIPISIHAPLAGCDGTARVRRSGLTYFNPRTPCGVRQAGAAGCPGAASISIHAPLAGCDGVLLHLLRALLISIHAPLAGCDSSPSRLPFLRQDFNPRTPCGVRPASGAGPPPSWGHFNPRTPCGVPVFPRRNSSTSQAPDTPSVREKMRISRVTRRSPRLSVNPPLWAFS